MIPQILRPGSRFSCEIIPGYPDIMTPLNADIAIAVISLRSIPILLFLVLI